jgi:hypothetical protein
MRTQALAVLVASICAASGASTATDVFLECKVRGWSTMYEKQPLEPPTATVTARLKTEARFQRYPELAEPVQISDHLRIEIDGPAAYALVLDTHFQPNDTLGNTSTDTHYRIVQFRAAINTLSSIEINRVTGEIAAWYRLDRTGKPTLTTEFSGKCVKSKPKKAAF